MSIITLSIDETNCLKVMLTEVKDDPQTEMEIVFSAVSRDAYTRVIKYLAKAVDRKEIESSDMLDASISATGSLKSYRVTIAGKEAINQYMQTYADTTADIIKQNLVKMEPSETVSVMYKDRKNCGKPLTGYPVRAKMAKEAVLTSLKDNEFALTGTEMINFRLKSRYSFRIGNLRVDATKVRAQQSLIRLPASEEKFEIEIEVISDKATVKEILVLTSKILCLIQDGARPLSIEEESQVTKIYQGLFDIEGKLFKLRKVVSVEYEDMSEYIPNSYAVTDKADGTRQQLFSCEKGVYFVDNNGGIHTTDLDDYASSDPSVLDGEIVIVDGKKVFLAFDTLYASGMNYYASSDFLPTRIGVLDQVIDTTYRANIPFIDYAQKGHTTITLDQVYKYYRKQLKKYWKTFKKKLENSTTTVVARKVHLFPYGICQSEVFRYWELMYDLYHHQQIVPYALDGIVLSPVKCPYQSAGMTIGGMKELKWKPPHLNTIDFYILLEKNNHAEFITYAGQDGQPDYRLAKLYVGNKIAEVQKPVPFRINGIHQSAALFLNDGKMYSEEKQIIANQTVVEFSYLDNEEIDSIFRWKPLRVRYDKTNNVVKSGVDYGNFQIIAERIWKTIQNPILEEHVKAMANPDSILEQIQFFREKSGIKKSSGYYGKVTSVGKGVRAFHNFLVDTLISTYTKKGSAVLDLACGRGGALDKFDRAGVKTYTGLDVDESSLFRIPDNANHRYQKKVKNGCSMIGNFIHADAGVPFTKESQTARFPKTSADNLEKIDTLLTNQYHVVNMQFAIHYLFQQNSWKTFQENLNQVMLPGSFLLLTTFDGDLIKTKLENRTNFSATYVDDTGEKKTLFQIRKMFSDEQEPSLGMTIELRNTMIWDNEFRPENLVFQDILIQDLLSNCGLELVETDSFGNMFRLHQGAFVGEQDEYPGVRQFYRAVLETDHPKHEENVAGYSLSVLNRYYVFRKIGKRDTGAVVTPTLSRTGKLTSRINKSMLVDNLNLDLDWTHSNVKDLFRDMEKNGIPLSTGNVYLLNRRRELSLVRKGNGKSNKIALFYEHKDNNVSPFYHTSADASSIPTNEESRRYFARSKYFLQNKDILKSM